MSAIVVNALIGRGQIWRLLTSTLLHINLLHLGFNLCWLWVFGTRVEEEFGTLALLAIMVFLGIGSSAADFAILEGGVGLSGIGYGLFGLLFVLSRKQERFADAMDAKTINLFVVWFFICIATTLTGLMAVANIAHGMGAVLGALLGWGISQRGSRALAGMIPRTILAVGCALLMLALAMFARPYLNLAANAGAEEAYRGGLALEKRRDREALQWYQDATRMKPKNAEWWYGLAYTQHRLQDYDSAGQAYARAAELEPGNTEYRLMADAFRDHRRASKINPATQPS